MQDRHFRIFQMTRLFIFICWAARENPSTSRWHGALLSTERGQGGGWGKKGIVGLFLGAVCTSLTRPCYCLCTSSRLELLLRGLSAFSPDNAQLCLTGDLRSVLVSAPGLRFKGKVQSKKKKLVISPQLQHIICWHCEKQNGAFL